MQLNLILKQIKKKSRIKNSNKDLFHMEKILLLQNKLTKQVKTK